MKKINAGQFSADIWPGGPTLIQLSSEKSTFTHLTEEDLLDLQHVVRRCLNKIAEAKQEYAHSLEEGRVRRLEQLAKDRKQESS